MHQPINLERIRDIAKQANRFKIDYELKYADKIVQKARRYVNCECFQYNLQTLHSLCL